MSTKNKLISLTLTVPHSLQSTLSKQPSALNKSPPIGEVTLFDFKNCAELNNLFLFCG